MITRSGKTYVYLTKKLEIKLEVKAQLNRRKIFNCLNILPLIVGLKKSKI